MKKLTICAFFLFVLTILARAQQKEESITTDGIRREFIIYIPSGINSNEKAPVIISLHGRLGTAAKQIAFADFRPIADGEKVIIVCPQGIDRSWNDGRQTPAQKKGVNDVKFIDQLITYVVETYHADAERIYVTGMSNGGFMSSRLACELPGRIAAIAVVGASMDEGMSYEPLKPVPAMYIQGTKDPLVPFAGGLMKKGAGGGIYGHEEILQAWAAVDHCDNKAVITNLPVRVADGTSVIKEEYMGSNGIKVVGFTIVNGGHTWPGGTQYLPRFVVGPLSNNLDACQEIWKFFKQFKLSR